MKKLLSVALMFVMLMGIAVSSFAGGHCKCKGDKGHYSGGIKDKFFHKVHFITLHEEELGLSEEQYDQIRDLKYEVKKGIATRSAEIKVVKIDIKKELGEDTIDTAKIDGMIDKKYELKKEKAKFLVASYAKLKSILTDEQKDEMKEIWKSYKKEKKCGK